MVRSSAARNAFSMHAYCSTGAQIPVWTSASAMNSPSAAQVSSGTTTSESSTPARLPASTLPPPPPGVALPALYARFPGLDLAVPADELRHKPVVTQNDLFELPVRLSPLS